MNIKENNDMLWSEKANLRERCGRKNLRNVEVEKKYWDKEHDLYEMSVVFKSDIIMKNNTPKETVMNELQWLEYQFTNYIHHELKDSFLYDELIDRVSSKIVHRLLERDALNFESFLNCDDVKKFIKNILSKDGHVK